MKRFLFIYFVLMIGPGFAGNGSNFYAYYTKVNNNEGWEAYSRTAEHSDIVVQLDEGRFVFQRSTSYLPYWETDNGQWSVEEIIPRRGDGPEKR